MAENQQAVACAIFPAIPSGSFAEQLLSWEGIRGEKIFSGKITEVMFIKTAGDAVTFDLEIRTEEGGVDVAKKYDASGITLRHHVVFNQPIPFITQQTGNKRGYIWAAIKPVGGTNGTYTVEIYSEPQTWE